MQRYNTTSADENRASLMDISDEEEKKEGDNQTLSTFHDLFEVHIKNMVEFKDKKGVP